MVQTLPHSFNVLGQSLLKLNASYPLRCQMIHKKIFLKVTRQTKKKPLSHPCLALILACCIAKNLPTSIPSNFLSFFLFLNKTDAKVPSALWLYPNSWNFLKHLLSFSQYNGTKEIESSQGLYWRSWLGFWARCCRAHKGVSGASNSRTSEEFDNILLSLYLKSKRSSQDSFLGPYYHQAKP